MFFFFHFQDEDVTINDIRFDKDHYNRNTSYNIYCVIGRGTNLRIEQTAHWSHGDGLQMKDSEVFINQAMRIKTAVINVTTKLVYDLAFIDKYLQHLCDVLSVNLLS